MFAMRNNVVLMFDIIPMNSLLVSIVLHGTASVIKKDFMKGSSKLG